MALFSVKRIHGLCYALPVTKGAQGGGTGRKAQAILKTLTLACTNRVAHWNIRWDSGHVAYWEG